MLTRREVEGELRSLGFRARARARREERERALKFARGLLGVIFGVTLLALLGFVNFLHTPPSDLAYGHSPSRAAEWVGGNAQGSSHRATSLFFTGRRTWHPNDPRGRNRHRGADD
ncbi:MAG: hypothetical protein IT293_10485 [Deltaproteobacteria bacterium]|nr:hypothetical protein [Deltaproteobacteria bacterium]